LAVSHGLFEILDKKPNEDNYDYNCKQIGIAKSTPF
jgi:hypothetical protein